MTAQDLEQTCWQLGQVCALDQSDDQVVARVAELVELLRASGQVRVLDDDEDHHDCWIVVSASELLMPANLVFTARSWAWAYWLGLGRFDQKDQLVYVVDVHAHGHQMGAMQAGGARKLRVIQGG